MLVFITLVKRDVRMVLFPFDRIRFIDFLIFHLPRGMTTGVPLIGESIFALFFEVAGTFFIFKRITVDAEN